MSESESIKPIEDYDGYVDLFQDTVFEDITNRLAEKVLKEKGEETLFKLLENSDEWNMDVLRTAGVNDLFEKDNQQFEM